MKTESLHPPLYNVLNEQRTQTDWRTQEPKENEGGVFYGILPKEPETIDGSYKCVGFYYPHSVQSKEEQQANANYIILSVNNLAPLAAALEGLIGNIDAMAIDRELFQSIQKGGMYIQAMEALKRIS